eukprot:g1401.t1
MSPPLPPSEQPASSPLAAPAPPSADASSGEVARVESPSPTVPSGGKKGRRRKKQGAAGGSPAAAAPEVQKLTHLVVDSGAIIKGAGMTLASAAENFWTIPEVVAEIRDKKARHHLESLPFELKLREPSDEAMKFASSFARQTGDFRSLSRVDLRVIALTYMLERQETGAEHLRTAPVRPGTKVNSKAKGVTAPALEPTQGENGELSATALPGATGTEPTTIATTDVGAAHGESPCDASVRTSATPATAASPAAGKSGAEGEAGGVDLLCAAVKQAWTDEMVGGEEGAVGAGERDEDGSDSGESSGGAGEGEVLEGGTDQRGEGDGDDHGKGAGDDDDWAPDGVSDGGEDDNSAGAATALANAPFSADDFPTLGGGSNSPAASAPASTSFPPPASVAAVTPMADKPTSSWSLMARSNPAPFKVPVKADPAPLPAANPAAAAAAAAASSTLAADSAGHFSSSGSAAPGAAAAPSRPRPDGAKAGTSRILSTAAAFGVTGGGAEDDDGEGWVNPSNIMSQKAAGIGLGGPSQSQTKGHYGGSGGKAALASKCRAGCVTTDFAMQNVLLQAGLPLLSLDGMAVRRVKQWILRCAACFKTCTEMDRLFCPVCGNASLDRVSCSVNARTGATQVHLRKNHKVNLRGSKFSIPAPNPSKGRFEGDLLLREDQLLSGIWAQKTRRKEKDVSSMFGENITGNVGLTVSKSADIVVGYGRKNPNAVRGRERRGKKSVKKRL